MTFNALFHKKKLIEFDGNGLTAFFAKCNFFEHSHLKEIVDSSDDVKGSVECETDSNNDKEEKENDDFKAENVKEYDDREEEKENEFEINR